MTEGVEARACVVAVVAEARVQPHDAEAQLGVDGGGRQCAGLVAGGRKFVRIEEAASAVLDIGFGEGPARERSADGETGAAQFDVLVMGEHHAGADAVELERRILVDRDARTERQLGEAQVELGELVLLRGIAGEDRLDRVAALVDLVIVLHRHELEPVPVGRLRELVIEDRILADRTNEGAVRPDVRVALPARSRHAAARRTHTAPDGARSRRGRR